jgi:hypothetical protein
MNTHAHAIVWIDHHETRILHFNDNDVLCTHVRPNDRHVHLHHKANTIGSGRAPVDHDYHREIAAKLGDSCLFLIVGPSTAKTELAASLADVGGADLQARLAGVQPIDHPTDNELVAHGRKFFKSYNRMHSPLASKR